MTTQWKHLSKAWVNLAWSGALHLSLPELLITSLGGWAIFVRISEHKIPVWKKIKTQSCLKLLNLLSKVVYFVKVSNINQGNCRFKYSKSLDKTVFTFAALYLFFSTNHINKEAISIDSVC